jgi:hypothetical protein
MPRRFSVLLVLLIGLGLPASHAQAPDGPLQRSHVQDYIRLRVEIHKMQEQMKANADQYDAVIQAFYKRQAEFLRSEGWTQDGFDAVEQRILAAKGAMNWAADSTQRQEKLAGIDQMTGLSEKQRRELRTATIRQDSIYRAQQIAPTRRDWPAVRPHLDALQHLTDYVAKNRPDPPTPADLPPQR